LSLQHHFDIVTSEDVAQFPEVVGGAHLRFFELHEPEPSESQPTPQANVKLIRRLVLKVGA
jgi:hypothetical protein